MNQIYSAIEETKFGENASTEAQCPYSRKFSSDKRGIRGLYLHWSFPVTPACDVPVAAKCGFLEKKEKFFFIEHQKKIYAFAHQNWMAMYHSKKDHKPFFTINLTTFQAKKVEGPKEKKELFQLNCQMDHTKIYIVRFFLQCSANRVLMVIVIFVCSSLQRQKRTLCNG